MADFYLMNVRHTTPNGNRQRGVALICVECDRRIFLRTSPNLDDVIDAADQHEADEHS